MMRQRNFVEEFYFWLWHDLLQLKEPISWIIVHSIRDHLFMWQLVGSMVNTIIWVLVMHFIAML